MTARKSQPSLDLVAALKRKGITADRWSQSAWGKNFSRKEARPAPTPAEVPIFRVAPESSETSLRDQMEMQLRDVLILTPVDDQPVPRLFQP